MYWFQFHTQVAFSRHIFFLLFWRSLYRGLPPWPFTWCRRDLQEGCDVVTVTNTPVSLELIVITWFCIVLQLFNGCLALSRFIGALWREGGVWRRSDFSSGAVFCRFRLRNYPLHRASCAALSGWKIVNFWIKNENRSNLWWLGKFGRSDSPWCPAHQGEFLPPFTP